LKHRRSENIPVFESLRMALVITSHHKYVQLSASNHVLLIPSRIGVVMTAHKLWPGIIVTILKHTSF